MRFVPAEDPLRGCSFCGTPRSKVEQLIEGPPAFICSECVALCEDILIEERDRSGSPRPQMPPELARKIGQLEPKLARYGLRLKLVEKAP